MLSVGRKTKTEKRVLSLVHPLLPKQPGVNDGPHPISQEINSLDKQSAAVPPERVQSLDVLRGFDMFWITGGEGIIHTQAAATGWQFFKFLSLELEHVPWEGFHFYDLIFPLFMFCVGVAIPWALIAKLERGFPKKALYKKVVTRFVILFFLGIIYNQGFRQNWANPRIGSVLGQLAFGYLFASLIALGVPRLRTVILWAGGILGGIAILHFLVPVPGFGAGVLTPQGSINGYVDRLFMSGDFWYYISPQGTMYELTQKMPPGSVPLWEAQGILNCITGTSITLMGVIAGLILRNPKIPQLRKVAIYFLTGVGLLISALVLKPWYPINKSLQTSTFYLYAGGFCFILLAPFYLVIDVWKIQKWGFFFKVIGMNAITVYMIFQLINVDHTSGVLVGGLAMYLGAYGPVLISVVTATLVWLSLYALYQKKIFLRV
jgi:predicted acyltransferase